MLTKKECLEALETMCSKCGYGTPCVGCIPYKKLEQLINEHFDMNSPSSGHVDNPPLSFEELKPDMWVWDNECKEYFQIGLDEWNIKDKFIWVLYSGLRKFEENRYFRKQVEV